MMSSSYEILTLTVNRVHGLNFQRYLSQMKLMKAEVST